MHRSENLAKGPAPVRQVRTLSPAPPNALHFDTETTNGAISVGADAGHKR